VPSLLFVADVQCFLVCLCNIYTTWHRRSVFPAAEAAAEAAVEAAAEAAAAAAESLNRRTAAATAAERALSPLFAPARSRPRLRVRRLFREPFSKGTSPLAGEATSLTYINIHLYDFNAFNSV